MQFLNDQTGATAIEYALTAALLAIVVIAAVSFLHNPVNGLFGGIVQHFEDIRP